MKSANDTPTRPATLHDLFICPRAFPRTLVELFESDYDELSDALAGEPLKDLALELRRQTIDAVHAESAKLASRAVPFRQTSATLGDLIDQWPDAQAATLTDLYRSDPDALTAALGESPVAMIVVELRRMVVEAVHASAGAGTPVSGPDVVRDLIERRHLRLRPHQWTISALEPDRTRMLISDPERGTVYLRRNYRQFPAVTKLRDDVVLPRACSYLIVYGGGLEPLGDDAVVAALSELAANGEVCDVLFNHIEAGQNGQPPVTTLYSVRAALGSRDGDDVELPDMYRRAAHLLRSAILNARGGDR